MALIKKPIIIAEIGTAHRGSLSKAKELILAAKESGADYAKFQIVFADEIIHPDTGSVPLPGGETPLYNVFKSMEKDEEFYFEISDYCKKYEIGFTASPFGIKSSRILNKIKPDYIKIASPELNHLPLLRECKSYDTELILSTGVSKLSDIERALEITGTNKCTLLHCITSYPAPPEEYNLKLLKTLKDIFGIKIGISDHSMDPLLIPLTSLVYDTAIIEKHFTFETRGDGLDDKIALTPSQFYNMTNRINQALKCKKDDFLLDLKKEFTHEKINLIIGDGVKKLARSEHNNYSRTRRTLHAIKDIEPNEKLNSTNCALLRTEKVLSIGMDPYQFELLKNPIAKKKLYSGEGITLNSV